MPALQRQGRAAAAGRTGPRTGRAADGGRQDGNPLRRGREKDRSCRRKKRAGGCRNADRMRKTQAGKLAGESSSVLKTQVRRPGDPATRRPGDPATRRPGDPATRRPGDPATRRPGDHYTVGTLSGVCQPPGRTDFVRHFAVQTKRPQNRRSRRPQRDPRGFHHGHRIASEPVARPAGAHSAQVCRASPVPFGVPYAEHGAKASSRAFVKSARTCLRTCLHTRRRRCPCRYRPPQSRPPQHRYRA